MRWFLLTTFLIFLSANQLLAFGPNIPEWMRAAARESLPAYPADTKAVVLLDEETTTVQDNGEIHTTYRRVIKILTTEGGRDYGYASVHFDNQTKLTFFRAWSISAKGEEYEVKEKEAIEASPYSGDLYSEERIKEIKIPAAEPGSIVGYEFDQKRRPFLFEDSWGIQEEAPVHRVRYILNLPPGWEYKNFWRNHAPVSPQQSGNSNTWELVDVSGIKPERGMPAALSVYALMYLKFVPSNPALKDKFLADWKDIGIWANQLAESQKTSSPEMKQKISELIAGSTSQLGKIRALASFAQRDVRYVAIEIGIGGFQPHQASDVFRSRFGDCKDKATLLTTMLHEIGVESYLVVAQTKRGVVEPNIPAAFSFNHMILAIKLPASDSPTSFPAMVTSKTLGPLLLFDPTSEYTQLGYLPNTELKSYGILETPAGGELVQFPLVTPQSNQFLRSAKLSLTADGKLTGEVTEVNTGGFASEFRAQELSLQPADRIKRLENLLSLSLTNYSVKDYQIKGLEDYDKDLELTYKIESNNYVMHAGSMLLVRPRVIGVKGYVVDMKERKQGYELRTPSLQVDDFEITLPEGFTVDELPPAVSLENLIASYKSESKLEDGPNGRKIMRYKRTYKVQDVYVPFEKLPEMNQFWSRIIRDEKNSAMLKLK